MNGHRAATFSARGIEPYHPGRIWTWRVKRNGHVFESPLWAVYEVNLSSMSDDYSPDDPDDPSAEELLEEYVRYALERYPDGVISIGWYVAGDGKFEQMPFRLERTRNPLYDEDFLTYYTWPTCAKTGERINWLRLPVCDQHWRPGYASKGGFIQEVTGWKPSILQPTVHLELFTKARG